MLYHEIIIQIFVQNDQKSLFIIIQYSTSLSLLYSKYLF